MIPLRIERLLVGQIVEQDRVEYKEGWNPNDIIHTICAFANDYNNMNGGYLVIGVQAKDGLPILPPKGIAANELDAIQQAIFQYCNQISPRYIPRIEVVDYKNSGVYLLYLWCVAGDSGPYQAPVSVYAEKGQKADRRMHYWIRPASLTTAAKQDEVAELFDKFNSVPYDDRVNRKASIKDIRRGFLEDFLRDSRSSLAEDINKSSLEELLLTLEVANETDTELDIRNIGVLMFTERPDKFIPGAQIDLVKFHTEEAEGSDDFTEKTFYGPIWKQVRDVLDYLYVNVIEEKVVKVQGQAEAERYFNYPYNALEEAIVNAVFHKSYREPEPVEIRVYIDKIIIINYPGLAKCINLDKFASGQAKARKYRNRRIGEFFKELDLSEKQGTGITKILKELRKNGSPKPEFEMDEDRTYLQTTIFIREGFSHIELPANSKVCNLLVEKPARILMSESMSKLVSESMSELEEQRWKILAAYLAEHDGISSTVAAELLGVHMKTAARLLLKAENIGLLLSYGKTRNKIYKKKEYIM